MRDVLWGLACCGCWLAGLSTLLATQAWYYRRRRYRCPACGRPALRFLMWRSSPWRRSDPPVRRYTCGSCGAAVEAGGVFPDDGPSGL